MDEIKNLYKEIQGVTDANRANIYAKFCSCAVNNQVSLKSFLKDTPIDSDSCHFEVYEALSGEGELFSSFLISEFERLMKLAESETNNEMLFQTLDAFSFLISEDISKTNEALKSILLIGIESKAIPVRRISTWMIGDFDINADPRIIEVLENKLVTDSDWRVRYTAYESLRELNPNNKNYKLSLLDKIKSLFSNSEYRYTYTDSLKIDNDTGDLANQTTISMKDKIKQHFSDIDNIVIYSLLIFLLVWVSFDKGVEAAILNIAVLSFLISGLYITAYFIFLFRAKNYAFGLSELVSFICFIAFSVYWLYEHGFTRKAV